MTVIKSITSVFILLLFSIIIGLSIQAQQQPNRSFRLTESELNLLIQQLENGGDTFRVSLTEAFFRRPHDRTRIEGNMNDALRGFKKATDQVRIRFDARQLGVDDVQRLLDQAQPLDNFMRDNPLTDRARNDWSTLRANLSVLANAYNVAPSLGNSRTSQTGSSSGEFIVRDGETLVVVLNNDLTTKQTKQGDRFTMTVRQPSQYEGAIIAGAVGSVDSGRGMTGRSKMSLNFDTIRLRNGQTYRFAGILENVRRLNGPIKVDGTELTIRSSGSR